MATEFDLSGLEACSSLRPGSGRRGGWASRTRIQQSPSVLSLVSGVLTALSDAWGGHFSAARYWGRCNYKGESCVRGDSCVKVTFPLAAGEGLGMSREIYVFVDPLRSSVDPEDSSCERERRLRRPFIPERLAKLHHEYREICVYEYQQKVMPIDISNASHIFVSWDSANGDSIPRSNITLQFFISEGRVRAEEVLQDGGTLFCECQTVEGLPVQAAYDAIFGSGEVTVNRVVLRSSERCGSNAEVAMESSGHPLLQGMNKNLSGGDPPWEGNPPEPPKLFFATFSDGMEASQDRPLMKHFPNSLWAGWFTYWGPDWIPLLVAADKIAADGDVRRPILLAKVRGKGLLLASTLWIGALRQDQLLRNIVDVPIKDMSEIREYHQSQMRSRKQKDAGLIGLVIAVELFIVGLLVYSYVGDVATWIKAIVSALGVSVIAFFVSSIGFLARHVWDRPHGMNIREARRRYRELKASQGGAILR